MQIYIYGDFYEYCGGALINTSFVVTSASCIGESVPTGLSITVIAGNHDWNLCEGTQQTSLVRVLLLDNITVFRAVTSGGGLRGPGPLSGSWGPLSENIDAP